jgi:hypothetical protein
MGYENKGNYSGLRENRYDSSANYRGSSGNAFYDAGCLRCPLCKQAPSDSHIGKYAGSGGVASVPVISGGYS